MLGTATQFWQNPPEQSRGFDLKEAGVKQVASRAFRRQSKWLSAVAIASIAIVAADISLGQTRPDAGASAAIDHGNQSLRIGAFAAAADQFRQAAAEYEKTGSPARQIEAISAEATALCNLGKYPDAIAVLRSAVRAAHASKDRRLEQLSTIQLAEALILSRNDEMGNSRLPTAQALLTSASDATHSDSVTPIALSSAFGDLYLAENKPDLAADSYAQSFTAAQAAGDDAAAAHAAANAALASLTQFKALTDPDRIVVSAAQRRQDAAQAIARAAAVRTMDNQAMAAAGKLSDSHDTAYVWLTVGQTEEGLAAAITSAGPGITAMPQPDPNLVAYSAYQSGLAAADAIGDATARAYALGYTGHLYELQKRIPDAMTLTRQGVFLAQQTQNSDCLYRWQWQTGRLLHASADQMRSSGDLAGARQADAEALESYRRAAMTLQSIRTDIGAGGGNQPANGSFHGVAEGVFYELADLLLRQADSDPTVSGEVLAQHDLLEARDTVEQLKTAQVQNYFHERCDALIQSKGVDVATINAKTAVIYLIPLRDRTELLVAEPAPRSPAAPDG
jgi:tetratricopeptide (TPR) repeat protein